MRPLLRRWIVPAACVVCALSLFAETGTQEAKPGAEAAPIEIGDELRLREDIRSVFARKSSVLLGPGGYGIELGTFYSYSDTVLPGGSTDVLRTVALPLILRAGLCRRVEGYISVPVLHARRETTLLDATLADPLAAVPNVTASQRISNSDAGLGDVSFGANWQILDQGIRRPDVVLSMGAVAPTGSGPYDVEPGQVVFGSGHWSFSGGVQCIFASDPLVLFWGLNVRQVLPETYAGSKIEPGLALGYDFGMGFAVNPDISLSAQLLGSYRGESEVAGRAVEGSSIEPILVAFGLTSRLGKSLYVEPAVSFGVSEDAPDVTLGVSLIHRFHR